jgi:hypothetical protein
MSLDSKTRRFAQPVCALRFREISRLRNPASKPNFKLGFAPAAAAEPAGPGLSGPDSDRLREAELSAITCLQ